RFPRRCHPHAPSPGRRGLHDCKRGSAHRRGRAHRRLPGPRRPTLANAPSPRAGEGWGEGEMISEKIFSADSHVSEPGDLWVQRIDKALQFRAPRLERREWKGRVEDFFLYEGFPPHPVAVGLGAAGKKDANGTIESFRET